MTSPRIRLLGLVCALGLASPLTAFAATITPVYTSTFADAVTGDNQFKDASRKRHWFVNTGADSYANDVYERPTIQNYETYTAKTLVGTDPELQLNKSYSATASDSPAYFGYLDITQGRFGYDSRYMYFSIELFSDKNYSADGSTKADFGESSYYNIRLSPDANGKNGLLLSAQNAKDLTSTFSTQSMYGYYDEDGSVGGPGGVDVPNEGQGQEPGYESVVIADGKAKDASTSPTLLKARRVNTGAGGAPVVEFAFDYAAFNALNFGPLNPDPDFDPTKINYLVFDTTRGLKGNGNYLWNDKYSLLQSGTPYTPANEPQNIYELDTLRGTFVIPLPSAAWAGAALLGLLAVRRTVRRGRA